MTFEIQTASGYKWDQKDSPNYFKEGKSIEIPCQKIAASHTWLCRTISDDPNSPLKPRTDTKKKYIKDFNTIEELLAFSEEVGNDIILSTNDSDQFDPHYPIITIYDSYIE